MHSGDFLGEVGHSMDRIIQVPLPPTFPCSDAGSSHVADFVRAARAFDGDGMASCQLRVPRRSHVPVVPDPTPIPLPQPAAMIDTDLQFPPVAETARVSHVVVGDARGRYRNRTESGALVTGRRAGAPFGPTCSSRRPGGERDPGWPGSAPTQAPTSGPVTRWERDASLRHRRKLQVCVDHRGRLLGVGPAMTGTWDRRLRAPACGRKSHNVRGTGIATWDSGWDRDRDKSCPRNAPSHRPSPSPPIP